jgi:multiple sugar transport system substrate-binding protein
MGNKRLSIVTVLLIFGAAVVFGGGSAERTVDAALPYSGQEITILIHSTVYRASGGEEPEGVIRTFERETGATVNVITAPSGGAIWERAVLEWVSGTGRYDVISLNTANVHPGIVRFVEPLDDRIASLPPDFDWEDIIQSGVQSAVFGGQTYGLPHRLGGGFFYFRKDLFEQYGISVPETVDEFAAAARALTLDENGDGRTDVWGLLQRAKEPQATVGDFMRYIYMHGGRILSEDQTRVALGDGPALEALQLWVDLLDEGVLPPDITAIGRDEQIGLMQQGRVAMTLGFTAYYSSFVDPVQSRLSADDVGWALTPTKPGVPLGRSDIGGWYVHLDRNSRNKDAAWALMLALTSKENQRRMAVEWGNAPVRHSSYEDPTLVQEVPPAPDWARSYAVSLSEAHPHWAEIEQIMHEEVVAALLKNKTPQNAIDAMVMRITQLL